MNTSDMVYIMNVDWNWIKQRPHFIAELLNENFNVHVMYQHRYGRSGLQQRTESKVDVKPIYVIPRGDRYGVLSKMNKKIKCNAIRKEIKRTSASILYLTFPDQVDAISDRYQGIVVYDCMDNHPAFIKNEHKKEKIILQEQELINRADLIFVSSEHLIKVLKSRYGNEIEGKVHLVRNGYNGEIIEPEKTRSMMNNDLYTFAYFGTISSWFNFNYILRSLEEFPDIQYELFGPVAGTQIPKHKRIHYHGTIEHDKLLDSVKNANCFIMPFIVNNIIESVDPVKLYEYINYDKNILVPYYKEIERFARFVYFYNSYDEFKKQINELKNSKKLKYSDTERKSFLIENSWNCRVKYINRILDRKGNIIR